MRSATGVRAAAWLSSLLVSLAVTGCVGPREGGASATEPSAPPTGSAKASTVVGLTFAGPPPAHPENDRFEGESRASSFFFVSEGTVRFNFSGSDENESGTWTQDGDRVVIETVNETIELHLVDEGRAVVVVATKERLARQ